MSKKHKSEICAAEPIDWRKPRDYNELAVELRFRDIRWQIASQIAWLLCSRGLTLEALAERTGLPLEEVALWLNGTWDGEMRLIAKIEVALGRYVLAFPHALEMRPWVGEGAVDNTVDEARQAFGFGFTEPTT